MTQASFKPPRRFRIGVVVVVVLIHVAVVIGLIRAFAPEFVGTVVNTVTAAVTVTITPPTPTPTPEPEPAPREAEPEEEGAAAPAGKQAKPREVSAPEPKIVIVETPAPPVASTGTANASGARDKGQGTGAGGSGQGTGSGNSGTDQGGGGGGTKAVKIAGNINSARDYPREGRDLRIGDYVTVVMTVGTDGRVKDCRIHRPSRDPAADQVTCRLASKRFRFRPATDAAGKPVESVYGWQQRWFYAGDN